MKAVINGHEVEGTPDEIASLMMIMNQETAETAAGAIEVKPPLGEFLPDKQLLQFQGKTICKGPCYCTGACMGKDYSHANSQSMWVKNEDMEPIKGMGDVIGQAKVKPKPKPNPNPDY